MPDNTTLPTPGLGDVIRTLDKGRSDHAETEVVTIDVGGQGENILTFPVPVALDVPQDDDGSPVMSLSSVTMDAIEILFRQLMAVMKRG